MPDAPVFLITGASTGIGAATARHAAAAGHRLVLAARSTDKLEALAQELGGAGQAMVAPCDVTDWSQQAAMVRHALDAFGRIDVVFANAGFGAQRGWLEETPEHWRDMVLTNVLGAAYTVRGAIPALKQTRGHVLLTELRPLEIPREEHPWGAHVDPLGNRWNPGREAQFVALSPERVIEVRYDHMDGGFFRHPATFVRWRPDRDAESCGFAQLEQPVGFDVGEIL